MKSFVKGSTVFACRACGRNTRCGDSSNLGLSLCDICVELSHAENKVINGQPVDLFRVDDLMAEIAYKGGDVKAWQEVFADADLGIKWEPIPPDEVEALDKMYAAR